jgi:hypothetical protein
VPPSSCRSSLGLRTRSFSSGRSVGSLRTLQNASKSEIDAGRRTRQ